MNYSEKDIENILSKVITDKKFDIIPVGNHNIGRHLVYKIDTERNKYIFKIYYIKGKRTREINSLKILKNSNVKVPNIIKYGEYDEHEWILMEYINGEILDSIFLSIDEENRVALFKELGEALGMIHSHEIFDYALGWDRKIGSNNFQDYKIIKMEERIEQIENQNLSDKELLLKAIDIIKENYKDIFRATEFRLTHNDFDGRNILVGEVGGIYKIKAIIDFEQSYPDNCENDLANLYFKYFIENEQYEKYFLDGYSLYMKIDDNFYSKLKLYLIVMVIEHCSWSYEKANEYYIENIKFLKKIL